MKPETEKNKKELKITADLLRDHKVCVISLQSVLKEEECL